jgi:hypothetical protein
LIPERFHLRQTHIGFDVPGAVPDLGRGVLEIAHLVDHQPTHSSAMEPVQFFAGSIGSKRGDAARAAAKSLDRVQRARVIRAVDGGLRNDHAVDVQRPMQRAHVRN